MAGHTIDKGKTGYRGRNSTADRAFDVLQLYSDDRLVLTSIEISEELGVARSTGYRYLQSLIGAGFIEEADTGFRLGPRNFELARLARKGLGLSEVSLPVMRDLAADVGESVLLTRRSGAAVVCLELIETSNPIRLSYERGHVLPLNAGAPAEILLAWLDPDEIRRLLKEAPLRAFTPRTLTTRAKLEAKLAQIRQEGVAVSRGELDPVVLGIAAPIHRDGSVEGAVSIAALSARVPEAKISQLSGAVQSAARSISERLALIEA